MAVYDEADRPIRSVSGAMAAGGSGFRRVGTAPCGGSSEDGMPSDGALTERAYDIAGHLVLERRCQDYVDEDGSIRVRQVETRYKYNAREQIYEVSQSHLASPHQPGRVIELATPVFKLIYDEQGRLSEHRRVNQVTEDLVTTYTYDSADRVNGISTGGASENEKIEIGYDLSGHVAFHSDGDKGKSWNIYDTWDRLTAQVLPSGALIERTFDDAGNILSEKMTGDDGEKLAERALHSTSFGEVDKTVEDLGLNADGEHLIRVTEREFDTSGRTVVVRSGPASGEPGGGDPLGNTLDRSPEQREVRIEYEAGSGRRAAVKYG
ncbi:MAG: hypothetical protein GY842_07995, partial [bacterium]|nr:hypothetical protein [bacterium]